MPDAQKLIRWSGLGMIAAGALYAPPAVLDGWRGAADIGTPDWWLVLSAAVAHHILLMFGLIGVLAVQLTRAGWLGIAGFVLTAVGNMLAAGAGAIQLTMLPALAAHPAAESALACLPFYPPATEAAAGFLVAACEPWEFDLLGAWAAGASLLLLLGAILLGIAIARAARLPRAAGLLLAAGSAARLGGLALALPETIDDATFLVTAAAYAWIGAALWSRCANGAPT